MRRSLAVVLLAALSLTGVSASPDALLYARFERYLEALRVQAGIPGMAAALVGDAAIVWERPFGRQNDDAAIPVQPDTPFHLDGLTQIVTAAMVLQCVDTGSLDLDVPVGSAYDPGNADPSATLRQILSHTRPSPAGGLVYSHEPARYDTLHEVIRYCKGESYRGSVATFIDALGMADTVPGIDAPTLLPPAEDVASVEVADRYAAVLARLATTYQVQDGRPVQTPHASTTLSPSTGLVATARDLAKLDVGIKQGLLIGPETLAAAWSPPAVGGLPGPHGLGWFVQVVNGELVIWQYGVSAVSSSFMMSLPNRRLTMILLANSNGLVEPFVLAPGDVTASPFARVFLGLVSP